MRVGAPELPARPKSGREQAPSNGGGASGPGRSGRMGRAMPFVFVALLIAAALAGYFFVLERDSSVDSVVAAEVETATFTVTRTDLQVRESLDGTLTYGGGAAVNASGAGLVTSLPSEGEIRAPGTSSTRSTANR